MKHAKLVRGNFLSSCLIVVVHDIGLAEVRKIELNSQKELRINEDLY